MSDLQLGLLVIGVLVVAGVIAYNKWQELRLRRRTHAEFGSRHEDVLLSRGAPADATPSREASTRDEPSHTGRERHEFSRAIDHTLVDDSPAVEPGPVESSPAAPAPGSGGPRVLEEAVDYIVALECPTATMGADILKHAATVAHEAMHRPIHWEAQDPAQGEWEQPVPQRRYRRVRAGMQLASRAGPASAEDIGAFCLALQEIALALGAELDVPDPDDAVRRAADLDRFCADVDVQVGLNVVAADGETFPGTKIRALAESAGMQYGRDGRFHRFSDGGAELFGLSNLEPMPFHAETMRTLATQGVTILLDVPRAPPAAATFRAYLEFARHAEQSLGRALVDDNRKPINQAALDSIAMQLDAIHKTMSARGIAPGGPLALRLFS
jgi:FtsZ-interacting cell division protein ZipA